MVSRLPGLQKLIMVQKAGAWRDGSETWDRNHSHTEVGDWDYEEPLDEVDSGMKGNCSITPWTCGGMGLLTHRGVLYSLYNPTEPPIYGDDGSYGVAIVPFEKLESAYVHCSSRKGGD
ncbi:hypothetical protein SBOR_4212 [Sclerotinia borealis F-4128]|uniref:Uncharacterized protein n=1 Tax=Sclerotinia borealis (strain F-4128) TaxID=1432307 RepID=W9CFA4_SCLBF|nr:hypothetical protein SBOR_4212 [Sclerotinia borealis F-4128]